MSKSAGTGKLLDSWSSTLQCAYMKRDMEFLYEVGTLRFINRSWVQFLSPNFANLAEHHFRVMWLALMIAAKEGLQDTEKVVKMALVHDIAESRAGDVHYVSRQYTERNEELGIKDMLADTALEEEFLSLWQEYEDRQSMEAKIVKDADNLDIDFELSEQSAMGNTVGESFHDARKQVSQNKLYTETAQAIWQEIQDSDPHDWHRFGRNRLNSGDWKK